MKSFQIWSFSGQYFTIFGLNTKLNSVNLCIEFKISGIWTRKISEFRHFSHLKYFRTNQYLSKKVPSLTRFYPLPINHFVDRWEKVCNSFDISKAFDKVYRGLLYKLLYRVKQNVKIIARQWKIFNIIEML